MLIALFLRKIRTPEEVFRLDEEDIVATAATKQTQIQTPRRKLSGL